MKASFLSQLKQFMNQHMFDQIFFTVQQTKQIEAVQKKMHRETLKNDFSYALHFGFSYRKNSKGN